MQSSRWTQLIEFLQSELAVPSTAINFGLKHCGERSSLLPIVLWQYGLVTLEQLDQIFDWLKTSQL